MRGISFLSEYPTKHVAYLNLWTHRNNIKHAIYNILPMEDTRFHDIIAENTYRHGELRHEENFCMTYAYRSYIS